MFGPDKGTPFNTSSNQARLLRLRQESNELTKRVQNQQNQASKHQNFLNYSKKLQQNANLKRAMTRSVSPYTITLVACVLAFMLVNAVNTLLLKTTKTKTTKILNYVSIGSAALGIMYCAYVVWKTASETELYINIFIFVAALIGMSVPVLMAREKEAYRSSRR